MYESKSLPKQPTFWLSFFFLGAAGMVVARMILLCLRKYRWLSYNSAFLILCLITCILRAIFFMFFGFWMEKPRHLLGLIMFWFPTNLQFATFSLLAVFYASITNASRWRSARIPVWITYGLLNLLFMAAFVVSVLLSKFDAARDRARTAITTSTFLLLVIALGYYGFRVWRILLASTSPVPKLHGISPLRLFVATLHIMAIYLSRAVYAVLSDVVPSLSLYFGNAGENLTNEIFSCIYIAVWEIVPTLIILILFWETTPAAKTYDQTSTLPFLNHQLNLNNDDDYYSTDDFSYSPLPTQYAPSNSIAYNTAPLRQSLSLLPASYEPQSLESP